MRPLAEMSLAEMHAEWSGLFQFQFKQPPKKATPERAARIVAQAAGARERVDAIDAEMRRRCVEFVRTVGARVDQVPNPYEGFTNGLYEEFRAGAAAYLLGVSEEDAMAMHSCYFRDAYHKTRDYVTRGRAVVGALDDIYDRRPCGAFVQADLFSQAVA